MRKWLGPVVLPSRHLRARRKAAEAVLQVEVFQKVKVVAPQARVVVRPVMEALRPEVEAVAPHYCAHRALRLLRKGCAGGLRLIGR